MKLLADWQCRASVVDMLRQLGWDVIAARDTGLPSTAADHELVAYAHGEGRVFLTFDLLRGESGSAVARRIREFGGRVLKVRGGPQQHAYTAVGRILFHHSEWSTFLDEQDGVADLSDLRQCKLYTASRYLQLAHSTGATQFEDYLSQKRKARSDIGRSRRTTPAGQGCMDLPDRSGLSRIG